MPIAKYVQVDNVVHPSKFRKSLLSSDSSLNFKKSYQNYGIIFCRVNDRNATGTVLESSQT